jgi:hypothetical protein
MEMGMDELLIKAETRGLPANWSAGMMGMMTMVRVLPENEFNEITALKKSAGEIGKEPRHGHRA